MRTSAGVTYLHGDHLGSTSVASSARGARVPARRRDHRAHIKFDIFAWA